MTGTLQIKRGVYHCVLSYKDKKGAWKQKWVSTGLEVKGNKRKAREALKELIVKYEKSGSEIKNRYDTDLSQFNSVLFTDYLMQWLEKKKNKVETVTFEGYKTLIDNHIYPYFEKKKFKLSEIKPSHIADFYENKFRNGRCDGKGGLSIRTIKMLAFIIKALY